MGGGWSWLGGAPDRTIDGSVFNQSSAVRRLPIGVLAIPRGDVSVEETPSVREGVGVTRSGRDRPTSNPSLASEIQNRLRFPNRYQTDPDHRPPAPPSPDTSHTSGVNGRAFSRVDRNLLLT